MTEVEQQAFASDLLSMDAVAQMLGISRRSVQRYAKAGLLPTPIRLGRRYVRWDRQALVKWLAESCKRAEETSEAILEEQLA